jgi:aspartyl/asparaginyl beta-hydroxylase (cupin superfamily)
MQLEFAKTGSGQNHLSGNLPGRVMHLGLDVPEGVAITVGGTTVEWREGKVITFDDSYRHSVEHNGDRDRCLHSFFGLHAAV